MPHFGGSAEMRHVPSLASLGPLAIMRGSFSPRPGPHRGYRSSGADGPPIPHLSSFPPG
jgi:hypothetical protein